MKKQDENTKIKDIDEFDEHVNLYNIITGGSQNGQTMLRKIVDQIEIDRYGNNGNFIYPSILITGAGKETAAKAFLNSLGYENIREIHAIMLEPTTGVRQYFCYDSTESAYLISNIENLKIGVTLVIHKILTNRKYGLYNYMKEVEDEFNVDGLVVMTTNNIKGVCEPIADAVDHVIELENITIQQLELIVLQRLKFAGIEIETDEILNEIVRYGFGDIHNIIKFIKDCYAIMRSEGRDKLMLKDVELVGKLNKLDKYFT